MDSLIKTKNHNTASFYPQNRVPVSLRKNKGLPPILYLDGHVDATDVLKTIPGRTRNNMRDGQRALVRRSRTEGNEKKCDEAGKKS